jgi:hypothetical protein
MNFDSFAVSQDLGLYSRRNSKENMEAALKRLYSSDITDVENYQPKEQDNFGFVLRALVRPTGQPVEESFDITVCTPRWLAKRLVG